MRALVLRVRLVRPYRSGQPRRLRVGLAGHERRDRRRVGATLVGVVGETALHEQRAEVRVADAELAVALGVRGDRRRRVVRAADEDLLRSEDDVDRAREARDIELAIGVQETHEVERGEVARGVVDAHVLGAIGDDEAVHEIRVVKGLGQVVDHRLAIGLSRDKMGSWFGPVASDVVEKSFELRLLSRTRESDPLGKALGITSRDPEIKGIGGVIRHRST